MKKPIALLLGSCLFASSFTYGQSFSNSQPQNPGRSFHESNSGQFSPIVWVKSYDEAIRLSQASSKPIVILFTAARLCPACVLLERDVLQHPQFNQALSEKFIFMKAQFPDLTENSVASSPYKALMDRNGVNAFPKMVVIDANGTRLFDVDYQSGGKDRNERTDLYVQNFLQKLSQSGN